MYGDRVAPDKSRSPRLFPINNLDTPKGQGENMEVWKDIPGYEGKYQVSTQGNIYSSRYNRYRKLRQDRHGYVFVALNKEGGQHFFLVHRLVAGAFIPNPDGKTEVNHIDGDKKNNRIENLEWVTHDENVQHSFEIGLRNKKEIKEPKQSSSKLTKELAQQIRCEYKRNVRGRGYKALAKKYHVSTPSIKDVVHNITWKQ